MGEARRYPGARTSPREVYALAEEYRAAALALKERGRRGQPLTWAPFRLCAIHAIELYLNAFLLEQGKNAAEIRSLQHNLTQRAELALHCGMSFRARTSEHIRTLDESREYLVTRYAPELASRISQINRLTATLDEVARKVSQMLRIAPPKAIASRLSV